MELPVIVAIIAAGVSLVATTANILIAKAARRSVLTQTQWEMSLRLVEEQLSRLRSQAAGAERLRTECQLFLTVVTSEDDDSADFRARIITRFERLREEYESFMHLWAETKVDIPSSELPSLRRLRHDISHPYQHLAMLVSIRLKGNINRNSKAHFQHAIAQITSVLDRFFAEINRFRVETMERALLLQVLPTISIGSVRAPRRAK
jgi:hypothetical protein